MLSGQVRGQQPNLHRDHTQYPKCQVLFFALCLGVVHAREFAKATVISMGVAGEWQLWMGEVLCVNVREQKTQATRFQ